MPDLLPSPVQDHSLQEVPEPLQTEFELPQPVVGFVGAAAVTFVGIAMCQKMLRSGRRKQRRRRALTLDERRLLRKVIARGEEKGWDFSFDEDFIFELLPALKAITG